MFRPALLSRPPACSHSRRGPKWSRPLFLIDFLSSPAPNTRPCPTPHPAPKLQETGLDQYAIVRYAEALEVVPRTIAENSGLSATDAVAALYNAHAAGQAGAGLDVETGGRRGGRGATVGGV